MDLERAWDLLHDKPRFRPSYPSESVVRFLARHCPPDPLRDKIVLDLGCGAGRHAAVVAEMLHAVAAVDLSRRGLEHARDVLKERRVPVCIAQCRMDAVPFRDGSFDAAIAYGVINYAGAHAFQRSIDEVWRVLKPGGWFLLVTRSQRDFRFGRGTAVGPSTFILDTDETNEQGMVMYFLSSEELGPALGRFSQVQVDYVDHSSGGGAILNSDWIIEAQK